MDYSAITQRLFEEKTCNIENYSRKLVPTDKTILGVSIPKLRKIASTIPKENILDFIQNYSEEYFEQLLLKGVAFSKVNSNDKNVLQIAEKFIGKINDWCVCDIFCQSFKYARKHPREVFEFLKTLAKENDEFKQRVVAVILLSHYIDDEYIDDMLALLTELNCGKYYTDMAIGWAVATAFAKQRDATYKFIISGKLTLNQYKISVKKMRESFRISQEDKDYFRDFKYEQKN